MPHLVGQCIKLSCFWLAEGGGVYVTVVVYAGTDFVRAFKRLLSAYFVLNVKCPVDCTSYSFSAVKTFKSEWQACVTRLPQALN